MLFLHNTPTSQMSSHLTGRGDDVFVYFAADSHDEVIRIGFTGKDDADERISDHENYGYRPIAVIPASSQHEKMLHDAFSRCRVQRGTDTSTYQYRFVFPYVDRLLDYHYAAPDPATARLLARVPWQLWSPQTLTAPLIEREQYTLFVTPGIKSEARDTWQTPSDIADICRMALGGTIDLDPASCYEANHRVKAKHFYNEQRNGLSLPWHGTVFLNPPYGGKEEPQAQVFTEYLICQIKKGNVKRAITILNLQSVPTLWFPTIRKHASAHAIWNKRIPFIGPLSKSGKSTAFGSSKNGTIFSFFGDPTDFMRAFRGHAMIVKEI